VLNFQRSNFADTVHAPTATLNEKVKSQSTTPLTYLNKIKKLYLTVLNASKPKLLLACLVGIN